MDWKQITGLVMGVVIGVLLLTTLAMPIISDATTTEKTFDNAGIYYMENPEEPITVEYLGGTDWNIDGEPLDYNVVGATNIIVIDDSIYVRNVGQVRGTAYAGWTSANLTVGEGIVTGTAVSGGNTTTINWTYTTAYIATNDHNAQYIMTNPSNTTYINSDSYLYGLGLSTVKDGNGDNQFVTFSVTVNGIDDVSVTSQTQQITIDNITVNYSEVAGYEDLYIFNSVTFDAKWGDSTTALTYNIIIAPSSVTSELSEHLDASTIAILNLVPLLITVGIIMAVVGVFVMRRE